MSSRHYDDDIVMTMYLLKRMSTEVLNFKTPLYVLSNCHIAFRFDAPSRIFGCIAFVHLHKNQYTKLDSFAVRCFWSMPYIRRATGVMILSPNVPISL